ncbi:UNVERIFIED_ORG: DNA primase [Idiomarina abyssalis]|uniref:DNA primase n=1 Tax=unclassified Idiomarina TaxID=2614829 RepID=UPI000E0E5B11|nr:MULTISPECIES: DNA primase [unclassified Idiomarina]TDO51871.1 DNA primase [Idiomarina sp. 017G]|tara:strand:+ start:5782 stop:7527 length:1746 start_codon:yes stop_codon:yes gene_type:complete
MAGLIPKSFIHDLLERADIVEIVDSRVPLKKAGRNHQACCPFHNEKTPSFTVSQDKQFYHCFGCGVHGNAIDFLMEFDGLNFPDAVEELAGIMGVEVPREQPENPQLAQKKQQQMQDDSELMSKTARFFQHQLKHHENSNRVIDYLKGRGLSGETVKRFQIGYAPDAWDGLLSTFGSSAPQRQQLLELKLINRNEKGRHYDFFRDRVMFPIHDRRGRVVGFGGRIIDGDGPKYLNSPETRLFHKGSELYGYWHMQQAVRKPEQVCIVEGYMDVVALSEAGIHYAVASLGTATTSEQLQRLFRTSGRIVCCYDGDRAGRDAAWRALENALPLLRDGLDMAFLFLPEGEDPDSVVREHGAEAFERELKKATPFTEYFFEHLQADIDVSSDAGRSQLLNIAKPLIEKVASEYYRDTLMQRLAEKLRRETSQLERQFEKPQRQSRPKESVKMTPLRKAIALLLQYPQLAQSVPVREELRELQVSGIDLLIALHKQCAERQMTTAQVLEGWRDTEYYQPLQKLALWQHQLDEDNVEQEFNDIFIYLIDQYFEQRANALLKKEQEGALTRVERQEYQTLIQYLSKAR